LEVGTHGQCEACGAALRVPGRCRSAGLATKCQQVGVGIEEREGRSEVTLRRVGPKAPAGDANGDANVTGDLMHSWHALLWRCSRCGRGCPGLDRREPPAMRLKTRRMQGPPRKVEEVATQTQGRREQKQSRSRGRSRGRCRRRRRRRRRHCTRADASTQPAELLRRSSVWRTGDRSASKKSGLGESCN